MYSPLQGTMTVGVPADSDARPAASKDGTASAPADRRSLSWQVAASSRGLYDSEAHPVAVLVGRLRAGPAERRGSGLPRRLPESLRRFSKSRASELSTEARSRFVAGAS